MNLPPPKPRWNRKKTTPKISPATNPFDLSQIPPPLEDELFKPPKVSVREFGPGLTENQVKRALDELIRRQSESYRIFEPLPLQKDFLDSVSPIRLLLGGNRAGKSLCGAIQCARIVSNQDSRYPTTGKFVIVGKDFDTIANGTWKVLASPGAFRIIRDPVTKQFRSVRPWDPYDAANKKLWRPSEPILPERLVKDVVWLNKGLGIPKKVVLHTGWEILVFSGESDPKAGFSADVAWIDEEIQSELFVREIRQRLVDRNGKLYWTATPENSTPALYGLFTHFLSQPQPKEGEIPDIQAWRLSAVDHPHHSEEARRIQAIDMSAEDFRVKMLGEFRLGSAIVFPEWDWAKLAVDSFTIPPNWTHYLSIDPGVNPCTVVFMAIPPDDDPHLDKKHKGKAYVYDELVVEQSSATKLAERLKEKLVHHGNPKFETFIIDHHGSRLTEAGSGQNAEDQYRKAFQEYRIESRSRGHGFMYGCDQPIVRINAVREWLKGADPKLRVFKNCATLKHQMERYRYERRKGAVTDKPLAKDNHAVDALAMLVESRPRHVAAKLKPSEVPVLKALAEKRKRLKDRKPSTFGPA